MTNPNTNPDYCKDAEKTALVRLCGVLGVLTENNDLATAALLAATRIERLEKKIPALNVDLAEASTHAYNGEIARMKLETENARLTAERDATSEDNRMLSERVQRLVDANKSLTAENERLSQLLHDEMSQLEIATDLGSKRWIALNQIYEDSEKHNANWCKRKAKEGLGIK